MDLQDLCLHQADNGHKDEKQAYVCTAERLQSTDCH